MKEKQIFTSQKQLTDEEYPKNLLLAVTNHSKHTLPVSFTKDVQAGIWYALSMLEEAEQELLWMHYGERKTLEEIGKHFDAPPEDVQKLKLLIFKKLRLPSRWNYMQYGIAGHVKKKGTDQYYKGYAVGYKAGYENGVEDAKKALVKDFAPEALIEQPIEVLNLSVRSYNCLRYNGCVRIKDVLKFNERDILRIRNLGPKSADEIARALHACGIKFTQWDKFLL